MSRAISLGQGGIRPPRKMVTIQVISCTNLVIPFSKVSEALPFFWYQFYTEDEHTSHNGTGVNPRFEDTMSYEVLFDSKAISYFENESLEIMFFDDSSDIPGIKDAGKAKVTETKTTGLGAKSEADKEKEKLAKAREEKDKLLNAPHADED